MQNLTIAQLLEMQKSLWEQNHERWSPLDPQHGKQFLMYMVKEIAESNSLIEENGCDSVAKYGKDRATFLAQMSKLLMLYADTLLRFDISSEEISQEIAKQNKKNTSSTHHSKAYDKMYSH